jgi:hypothetical protein
MPVIRRSLSSAAEALFHSLRTTAPTGATVAQLARPQEFQTDNTGSNGVNDQEFPVISRSFSGALPPPEVPGVIRRFPESGDHGGSAPDGSAMNYRSPLGWGHESTAQHARELDELIDRIVDKLELRIRDDLARRGRWRTPEVF